MTSPPSSQQLHEAQIVSRHLPDGFTADSAASQLEDSLKLQGGDLHRDLFKINARAKLQQRAATFANLPVIHRAETNPDFTPTEQLAPGGFRRQFLLKQHNRFQSFSRPMASNFVAFLDLYGSFAGEDLAESEDESTLDGEDEEETEDHDAEDDDLPTERRPLLGQRKSSRRLPKQGDASNIKTFFTLIKAFVGTGIMFLPKAFRNGGILFSSIVMLIVSLVTCLSFHLLLQSRKACGGGGYGEIGQAISGRAFRNVILLSVTISQIGFVCAGMIFTAENIYTFLEAVSRGPTAASINLLIGFQVITLVPMAFIRNISKLGFAALLADVFILIGLVYIYWFDVHTLVAQGVDPSVRAFNPRDFALTVGSAIFTFEGIGLILPIQSSMAHPEAFPRLLYMVMGIITVIFTSIGVLCYATFGDSTKVLIIANFPQDSALVNSVQLLYSLAVLIGTPVQLFPAIRILESKLYGERASGKRSPVLKWKKNAFRTALVLLCGVVAAGGANDLDKFVALIGSFACVPLVYIYPAMLHYSGVASGRWKVIDATLIVVGLIAMIYTTAITLVRWAEA